MKTFLITNKAGAYWTIQAYDKYDAEDRWYDLTQYKQGYIDRVETTE
jgi:hypothetical protein